MKVKEIIQIFENGDKLMLKLKITLQFEKSTLGK